MDDADIKRIPSVLEAIEHDTRQIGFTMGSEPKTGALLRTLAATKPAGRILELGTGTGIGTAWLLAGMDANAKLDSVDSDASVLEIAKRHLGDDLRVTFHLSDGAQFLPMHVLHTISSSRTPGRANTTILMTRCHCSGSAVFIL